METRLQVLQASVFPSVSNVEDAGVPIGSLHLLRCKTSDAVAASASVVASAEARSGAMISHGNHETCERLNRATESEEGELSQCVRANLRCLVPRISFWPYFLQL